jgi:hypothetical protein
MRSGKTRSKKACLSNKGRLVLELPNIAENYGPSAFADVLGISEDTRKTINRET